MIYYNFIAELIVWLILTIQLKLEKGWVMVLPVPMDAVNQSVMIVMVRIFVFMVEVKINVKLAAPRWPIPSVSVVSKSINALNATLPHLTSVSVVRQSIHALNATLPHLCSVSVVRESVNALNATLPHLTSVNCVVLVSSSAKADALTVISYR